MSGIQKKISKHPKKKKKQENVTHNEEKTQSIKINSEMTQMIELVDRDIKTVFITVSHMA